MRKKSVFYGLSPVEIMMAIAGGLAMFLSSREGVRYLSESLGSAYVALIAVVTSVVLIAVFRSYEVIGAAIVTSMLLFAVEYVVYCVNAVINHFEFGSALLLDISEHTCVYWFIIWIVPTVICMGIRIVSLKYITQDELLEDFSLFFRAATISFYIFYVIIILGTMVFTMPIGSVLNISFNLIPFFAQPHLYFMDSLNITLANLILLVPVGYSFTVFYPKLHIMEKLIIGLIISIAVRMLVCVFSTGVFDITYIILNCLGLLIGIGLKISVDKIYSMVSAGTEKALRYSAN